jgi:hypothetical protein
MMSCPSLPRDSTQRQPTSSWSPRPGREVPATWKDSPEMDLLGKRITLRKGTGAKSDQQGFITPAQLRGICVKWGARLCQY